MTLLYVYTVYLYYAYCTYIISHVRIYGNINSILWWHIVNKNNLFRCCGWYVVILYVSDGHNLNKVGGSFWLFYLKVKMNVLFDCSISQMSVYQTYFLLRGRGECVHVYNTQGGGSGRGFSKSSILFFVYLKKQEILFFLALWHISIYSLNV